MATIASMSAVLRANTVEFEQGMKRAMRATGELDSTVNKFSRSAAQVIDATRTPLETMIGNFQKASENVNRLFKQGRIDADTFNRSLTQLGQGFAQIRQQAQLAGVAAGRWGEIVRQAQLAGINTAGFRADRPFNANRALLETGFENSPAAIRARLGVSGAEAIAAATGTAAATGRLNPYTRAFAARTIGPAALLGLGRGGLREAEGIAAGERENVFGPEWKQTLAEAAALSKSIDQTWSNIKVSFGSVLALTLGWVQQLVTGRNVFKEIVDAQRDNQREVERGQGLQQMLQVTTDLRTEVDRLEDEIKFFNEPNKNDLLADALTRRQPGFRPGIHESLLEERRGAQARLRELEAGRAEVELYELAEFESNAIRARENVAGLVNSFFDSIVDGFREVNPAVQELLDRAREMGRQAAAIREAVKTPAERVVGDIANIQGLRRGGFLDPDTGRRAMEQAILQFLPERPRVSGRLAGAYVAGSAEAVSALNRARAESDAARANRASEAERRAQAQQIIRLIERSVGVLEAIERVTGGPVTLRP